VSLNDLPAEVLDDLVYVLRLAALTEDRTKREQKALDRLAAKVDKQRNRQSAYAPTSGEVSRLSEAVAL